MRSSTSPVAAYLLENQSLRNFHDAFPMHPRPIKKFLESDVEIPLDLPWPVVIPLQFHKDLIEDYTLATCEYFALPSLLMTENTNPTAVANLFAKSDGDSQNYLQALLAIPSLLFK